LGLTDGQTNLPVKVKVIHDFNRMKKYDYAEVVTALRDSVTLDITGPEGLEEIRRKVPFDPNKTDNREQRTVYVKGFGEELPSSQFDIEAFFAQYGPTNSVRLRRTDDKLFKGSCYIEFQDEETAQSFLALDPKPLWKGKHELEIMSKLDYQAKKNLAIRSEEAEPNATRPFRGGGKGGRGGGYRGNRDRRDAGDRDPDDWKKRREDDQRSGFRDNRRDRDNNRHHNGRGGRGRGRGNDRDRRNNDRNLERDHGDRYV
jgi:lupus La protein